MKIAYIEMSGFRGFRSRTRVAFPEGFLVLCGSNGSGKSTVCDAIEFALTGTIRSGSAHKEKGEGVHDYIWWRGGPLDEQGYVELGLVDDGGEITRVRRTARAANMTEHELRILLVAPHAVLRAPLEQLCRTTIVRDEEITAFSIDLKETERFAFVQSALGTADFDDEVSRLKKLAELVREDSARAARDYDLERERASDLATRLGKARADASKALGVAEAEAFLRTLSGGRDDDLTVVMDGCERRIGTNRKRADELAVAVRRLRELHDARVRDASSSHVEEVAALEQQIGRAAAEEAKARTVADATAQALAHVQAVSPTLGARAQLLEYGERVGLVHECCPLCGVSRTETEYEAHIAKVREEIDRQNSEVNTRSREAADASLILRRAGESLDRVRRQLAEVRGAETERNAEIRRILEAVNHPEDERHDDLGPVMEAMSREVDTLRLENERVESALLQVRASQAASLVVELERELAAAQSRVAGADARRSQIAGAQSQVRESEQAIRRLQGELVDEQLAALLPLLSEIYRRLRPHVDWPDVSYNLRGDIRRMLSLEVGGGLNPSFMFSSGQRRAAGLAFLFAIHLSRDWCQLDTLVLDDPVQHVDDYRALHLTELLGSIRLGKRQVVCTVEDEALAKLLARRLRSSAEEPGRMMRLEYGAGEGCRIAEMWDIAPLAHAVLVESSSTV